jgi:hypothetical protein
VAVDPASFVVPVSSVERLGSMGNRRKTMTTENGQSVAPLHPIVIVPVEYECDKITSIRRCASAEFPWGTAPEYWYIKRPLFTMDAVEIGFSREWIKHLKAEGFDVAYWDGEKWWHHSPKQFATPQDAWLEWDAKVRSR